MRRSKFRNNKNRKLNISVLKHILISNNLSVMNEICDFRVLRLNRSFVKDLIIKSRMFDNIIIKIFDHKKNDVLIYIIHSNDLIS